MATLISAFQISKSFASKTLFTSISFAIDTEQKIGLVGPNGAGKTTLLKILSGAMKPDSGQLSTSNSLRLGYLEQKPVLEAGKSIYETLVEATDDPYDGLNIGLAFELIKKLSLDETAEAENTDVGKLSGGWQKRVALARELMKRPTLLLLDEPTNHLDIQSILWLEDFIANQHQISFCIVTHDRAFLQNTCTAIFDLDPRNPDGIIKSMGTYGQYLETKQMILDSQRRLEDKTRNTMLIEKAWLARGPQARLKKQQARQNRAHELIDAVDKLENKNTLRKSDFDFSTTGNSPKRLIELTKASKSFGARNLFTDLSGLIRPKARIGLLGSNGCGKSTLIKLMLGLEQPTSGEVFANPDIQINYFEQGKETLNQNIPVIKVVAPEGDYVHLQGNPVYARSYLSRFHFNNFQMDMPVSKLSGGEQSRLLLAKLMLTSAHVLILDEPTNDLDVETLDVLTECLADFPGAIILVSHDRFFLDQNTNELWAFTENAKGEIIKFADYYQWESWFRNEGIEAKKEGIAAAEAAAKAPAKPGSSSNKKLSYKETLEFETMEKNIGAKEAELTKVQADLDKSENQANHIKLQELSSLSATLEGEIAKMYSRWQELEAKVKS
ncbi:MAG: ABC-F family ATP-binding cassette domain-containing protein [Bdellovibrionota bacterium]